MELSGIIIQKIKKEGPLCFREFMEMCLYYPDLGYYTSNRNKIGGDGDFYTSACLTPVFGTLIARQLEEMWHLMGEAAFTIVEYGAGTGSLCHDILEHLKTNTKMYDGLRYCIIEKSPAMRTIEQKHLHEKVYWYDRIEEVGRINGCILSNELVDNFSVHQVVMEKELMEVFVDYQDGFTEILRPAKEALNRYLEELNITLPVNFRTEINLQAIGWIKDVAGALNKGYVMTIDYGHRSAELYKPCRSQGTILCYHNHSVNGSVYDNIGTQDITSHVNFSALSDWGSKNGLSECGFTDQCHFLLALGFKECIDRALSHEKDIITAARKASILGHTLLVDMGNKFKVLIQEKGRCEKRLSGLRFSQAEINC
jgi:SAM-dependent MidA family methyltransferase